MSTLFKVPERHEFTAGDFATFSAACKTVGQMMSQRLEEILSQAFVYHLGYVPSLEEVKLHAVCGIHPDKTKEYKWKGVTILTIEAPDPSSPFEIRFSY